MISAMGEEISRGKGEQLAVLYREVMAGLHEKARLE
jgi:hypothetical protein